MFVLARLHVPPFMQRVARLRVRFLPEPWPPRAHMTRGGFLFSRLHVGYHPASFGQFGT